MTRSSVAAIAVLLVSAASAFAATPQQQCDYKRISASRKFESCVASVLAKHAKGVDFDEFAALAKCRHTYFRNWNLFQSSTALTGSSCIGSRFVDNGDLTVTDNLTTLVWEKKTGTPDNMQSGDPHDPDNGYTWGGNGVEFGGSFAFLYQLNGAFFAGADGWRLPTLSELQTILLDFACSGSGNGPRCVCPSSPCIDPALDPTTTPATPYWSNTRELPVQFFARTWEVDFLQGTVFAGQQGGGENARAVRGGL